MSTLVACLLGGLLSYVSVFLKGFQHQNVIGGHYQWEFGVSYLMAVADVLMVGFVVNKGWLMAMPMGTGAALGIVTSMYLHRKFVSKTGDRK